MKYLIVLACVLIGVIANEKYTNKYDNINVREILENDRLRNGYVDCVMERGKCTPEGKTLKEHLRDAIETGCSKCTESQENGATETIDYLIKHHRVIWNELTAKFDPTGKWRKEYEERAKAKGIEIPSDK